MADKIISAAVLREQLGIDPDGDCEKCRFQGMFGCQQSGDFVRACTAIDDCPAVDTLPAGWVPVSERLPDRDTVVLVWGGKSIYTAVYGDRGGFYNQWWKLNSTNHHCNPTHWMPLPESPKEA